MIDETAPIIALRNIQKLYGRNEVLDIPELELQRGEAVLFWGPNASGKSTLLRLLAGITVQTRGSLWLNPDFRTACRFMLPQVGGLYEDLSIRQNLLVISRLHNRSPDEAPFTALLDDDARKSLDRPLGTLSGGMQRIVSIAAFLSLRPGLLFLDEPFSGLDTPHRDRLREILRETGAAIPLLVLTGHNPDPAGGDWRTIAVSGGRIEGTT